MIRDDMLAAFALFREGVEAKCRKDDLSDMTDFERAGMLLAIYGDDLTHFDRRTKLAETRTAYERWPRARELVDVALDE